MSRDAADWLRLHEKGGTVNEVPCHHTLDQFLGAYIEAAQIADDTEGPLFRAWRSGARQRREMDQSSVHRMMRHRLRQAGIRSRAGKSQLSRHRHHQLPQKSRQAPTGPADGRPRQPALYYRRGDEISVNEIERLSY